MAALQEATASSDEYENDDEALKRNAVSAINNVGKTESVYEKLQEVVNESVYESRQKETSYEELRGRSGGNVYQNHQKETSYEELRGRSGESVYESRQKETSYEELRGRSGESVYQNHQKEASYKGRPRKSIYQSLQSKASFGEVLDNVDTNKVPMVSCDMTYNSITGAPEVILKNDAINNVNKESHKSQHKLFHIKMAVFVTATFLVVTVLVLGIILGITNSKTRNSNNSFNTSTPNISSDSEVIGKWRRMAYFNTLDNATTRCPEKLSFLFYPPSCYSLSYAGCAFARFPSDGQNYSRVRGSISGLQSGSPDGFLRLFAQARRIHTLRDNYVDGVVLIHEGNPDRHIWTFAVNTIANLNDVECSSCDCGRPQFLNTSHFYSCSLGKQCPHGNDFCGQWNGTFYRELPQPTAEGIGMRLCRDEPQKFEDILITSVEIYVQ